MQQVAKKKNPETKKIKIWLQNLLLVLIILFLLTIIAIGGILFFNIGGAKPALLNHLATWPLLGNVIKPIAMEKTPEEIQLEMIELQKRDLEIKSKQLDEKEKELEEKEKALIDKEELLKEKENQLNETLERLNNKLSSVREQVEYLEKMESSKAVQILSNMESKDTVIQILRNMKKEKSSSILMLMDPIQAAQILEEISAPESIN